MSETTALPSHAPWCRRHEAESRVSWCTSRTVQVGGVALEVSNDAPDHSMRLYGLSDFGEKPVDLDTAEQLGRALLTLVDEARHGAEARRP